MARLLRIEWHDDAESLGKLYQAEKDLQNRRRLHALRLLRQERKMSDVAAIIGVDYRTVQEWVSWYRKGGVTEVLSHRHGGHSAQKRRLSTEQEAELKQAADAGEIRGIHDGVAWAKAHQVTYTYWGMRHVFHRLNLRRKVPRPRNPKASETEQEAWKKGGSGPN